MSEGRDEKGKFIKGSKVNLGCVHSTARREKHSVAMSGRTLTDEHKEKIKAGLARAVDEGRRIGVLKGHIPWNKGMRIANGDPIPPRPPLSEESKKRYGAASKKRWANHSPERKSELIKAMLRVASPNKSELYLADLLEDMYPGEWKFVGNGQVIIAGKCPDFINVNGQKKIIEFYGERWHEGDDPKDRAAIFAPYGYETMVVWSKELRSIETLKGKIKGFNKHRQEAEQAA